MQGIRQNMSALQECGLGPDQSTGRSFGLHRCRPSIPSLTLADVMATGYHAAASAEVKEGDDRRRHG